MKTRNENIWFPFLAIMSILALFALIWQGADRLVFHGIYHWAATRPEYFAMIAELAAVYGLLAVSFCVLRKKSWKYGTAAVICVVFFWCHRVFLPMAVAAIYLLYIQGVGYWFRGFVWKQSMEEGIFVDFLTGSAFVIVVFCLMSMAGAGSIPMLRLTVLVTGGAMAVCFRKKRPRPLPEIENKVQGLMLAFMILMVLLEAGRMNISVDHDTLWYSVRSEYMLDNGPKGIYENMGTVSLVYTYSKGWEILTLPLADLPSHSFLLAFNLWVTVFVLYTAYQIGRYHMEKPCAYLAPFLMAGVPGIMNTGISGKTDNITLLFQLFLILFLTKYLKDKHPVYQAAGIGALLVSWTMKPTAIVFSTAVFGMSGLYLLAAKKLNLKMGIKQWFLVFPCVAALILVWYRTWLFTGVPATSIFSGIFQKIGFRVKYPFLVWDIPDYGSKPSLTEELAQLGKRLYGVFILPEGDEMSRVLISWCSLTVVFFLLVWILFLLMKKREQKKERNDLSGYQLCLLIPLILVSIYSIYSLKQIDGNYFILLYTLVILYGCTMISRLESRKVQRLIWILIVPLTLFNAMMISLSNLAWSVGFTKISLIHPGYYDHEALEHQTMVEKGNQQIWEILEENQETRVIAFGSHPEVLAFPCNVQSYVDICSSSGNEQLVESMEAFREYMEYAKTDYIYVEAGNMAVDYMGYDLLKECIKAGILTDVVCENGNVLAVVDLDGKPGSQAEQNLKMFETEYRVKEEG